MPKKTPENVSTIINGLTGIVIGTDDDQQSRVYANLTGKAGDKDVAVDFLYGCLTFRGQRGAFSALQALLDDEDRLAKLVQEHMASKVLSS